jgi:hypothetical protein
VTSLSNAKVGRFKVGPPVGEPRRLSMVPSKMWLNGHVEVDQACMYSVLVLQPDKDISQNFISNNRSSYIPLHLIGAQVSIVATMSDSGRQCSGTDCNNEAGTLQCPTCLKLGVQGSYFCNQDCFKRNWVG